MPDSKENNQPRLNESLVCDVCGRFGAVEFGDRKLCPDCYESYGSCCPEFGREDCEKTCATESNGHSSERVVSSPSPPRSGGEGRGEVVLRVQGKIGELRIASDPDFQSPPEEPTSSTKTPSSGKFPS